MTTKEKAKELIDKYVQISESSNEYTTYNYDKQCALIAVDEILKTYKQSLNVYPEYWKEVKTEIKKYDR